MTKVAPGAGAPGTSGRDSAWNDLAFPGFGQAARFREASWWREQTFLDDLAAAVRDRADHPAVIGYEDGKPARSLTYSELDALVTRFAAALTELGIGPGSVVVLHLPNWWQLPVLYLACARVGAVVAPVALNLGAAELRHVLSYSQASACVTAASYDGIDYAARLAEAAPPSLKHQVIIGGSGQHGTVDFGTFFIGTPRDDQCPLAGAVPVGPDEPSLLLFTSGTTGQMKGVVHSPNTLYAAFRGELLPLGIGPDDVLCSPGYMTHLAAMFSFYLAVMAGATCVVTGTNADMGLLLDIIETHRVTYVYAAPSYVLQALAEQRARSRDTSSLRLLVTGSAPIPQRLPAEVREVLGIELRALWGMTENGCVTITRADDPAGWAAHSDGSPVPWMDVRIEPGEETGEETDAAAGAGRLLVRGASMCLGYLGQPDTYAACLDGDGWFDTGDLARDDGRGGIKIAGRQGDLIARGNGHKVSVLETESALMSHPDITDVVLVGYPDPEAPGSELVAAIIIPVSDTSPPVLGDLRQFLEEIGMARKNWPDRLIYIREIPRNPLGKIQRAELHERLAVVASRQRR